MAKEEIVEGLKYAIAKGDKIENAIMSFSNAGYSKEDIEEAVRIVQTPQPLQTQAQLIQQSGQFGQQPVQQPIPQTPQIPLTQPGQPIQQTPQLPQTQVQTVQQQIQQPVQQPVPIVTQRVSAYGEKPDSGGKTLMMVLVFALIFLLGILIVVFLFRDQLATFLEKLF